MKLVSQHFPECSFCGCKFPPQWEPIMHDGKPYCSKKCTHFAELNLTAEIADEAQTKRQARYRNRHHDRTPRN